MASNRDSWFNFFNANVPELTSLPKSLDIFECDDIADVLKHYARGKCLVLDLDNTVIEPEHAHEELGSDQWFGFLMSYAKSLKLDRDDVDAALHVIAIYHAVQHHVQLKLIQPEIVGIINLFMNLQNPVIFLTMRGREIAEPTIKQLERNGISLVKQWGDEEYLLDIGDGDSEHAPIFKSGGIYCGGKPKEKCLKAFMTLLNLKWDIIMVDDKKKYLEPVIKMVNELGGNAVGLRYGRLDEKVNKHDFARAQTKLQEMQHRLASDAQESMVKLGLKK